MTGFENLTKDNILLFAIKAYEHPHYVLSALDEDLKHFSYVRRLFRRYHLYGDLKERLILNHLVILYNVFGVAATRLLYYHTPPDEYDTLKTFLVYLNYQPEVVRGIKGLDIHSSDIPLDCVIIKALRELIPHGRTTEVVG